MSEIRPDYIDSNWVSDKVWEFISNLDFNGYILAGNSVANMIEKIPLQGDLDFWVQKLDDYFTVFNYMHKYYDHFNLYPSMVEMIDTNGIYPRINLLYTNLDSVQLINNFDFPYCRCLWTPQTGIIYQNDCEKSIKSKQIQYINLKDIKNKRILKAINYGYKFDQLFWNQYSYLLLDVSLYKLKEISLYKEITIQDLDISQFQMKEFKINITNKEDIENTLDEINLQYNQFKGINNIKLPILLQFKVEQFKIEQFKVEQVDEINLLRKYIQQIVFKNPLSNTRYLELHNGIQFGQEKIEEKKLDNNFIDSLPIKDKISRVIQLNEMNPRVFN